MEKRNFLLPLFLTAYISAGLSIGINSAKAQSRSCYEVQDPDGWVNVRDRASKKIVAQIDGGQQFLAEGTTGDSVILAAPHNQFVIHRSRLRQVRVSVKCYRYTAIERDGYLNLREVPQGKILKRIKNGTALIILGQPEKEWFRVLTPDASMGFVYSPALEIYTY
jgi:hypothetical protein